MNTTTKNTINDDPYEDEYIAVVHTEATWEADVLDDNHFYLVLKA